MFGLVKFLKDKLTEVENQGLAHNLSALVDKSVVIVRNPSGPFVIDILPPFAPWFLRIILEQDKKTLQYSITEIQVLSPEVVSNVDQ